MADFLQRGGADDYSGMGNEPLPWDDPGDSSLVWYINPGILNILPTGRTLAYTEETAYWPITGEGGLTLEVRASGSVPFTWVISEETEGEGNTHNLFVYTDDNYTGEQQRSVLKIVAITGDSAYSATTLLVKNPGEVTPRIYVSPDTLTVSSAATSATFNVIAENCVYHHFEVTGTGGNWSPIPTPTADGTKITLTFNANTGGQRSATYSMLLYPTTGTYKANVFLAITQEEGAAPEPEPPSSGDTGDTGYTWYTDASVLTVSPTSRTLSATEQTAYWPVTAVGLSNLSLRSSGDVSFTYTLTEEQDPSYNTHKLYCYTEDNTGSTRQESRLEIVGYKGTSAYSTTFYLFKNSPTTAFITASPNPLQVPSNDNSASVYLTFTNCTRSFEDELTGNTQLAGWLSVRRSDNSLFFAFGSNTGGTERTTYYMAYGRDDQNRLVSCRIDIKQAGGEKAITITPSRTVLSKEAGSLTCEINSTENGNFTFSASSWMHVTSYSATSTHGGILYIDYTANEGEWSRTGEINVSQQIESAPFTLNASTNITQEVSSATAYINVTPTGATVTRQSGYTQFEVTYGGLATAPGVIEGEGNMNIISYVLESGELVVYYGGNDSATEKTKTLYITGSSTNGQTIQREVKLRQTGTGVPVAPIWRDYVLDLAMPGLSYINYTITYNGETVYTGRAYAMPDANGIVIFFNQLVKSYLSNSINFTEGFQTVNDWLGNFTITSPELGDIQSVAFYEDYSYENREMQNVMTLNKPITNEVPEGGLVPFSFFITGTTGTVTIYTNLP